MKSLAIVFREHQIHLLAEHAVWIPSLGCLCISDTHFGKATTFRQMGLAVPVGTTKSMLERIDRLLEKTGASQLVVLGDWIHHSKTAQKDYIEELTAWRANRSELQITCVEGNHDRYNRRLLAELRLNLILEGTNMQSFQLCHYPIDAEENPNHRGLVKDLDAIFSRSQSIRLCGHRHPCTQLLIAPKLYKRFPCFVLTAHQIILPAFGEFTGMATVQPQSYQRLVACVDGNLVPLPAVG